MDSRRLLWLAERSDALRELRNSENEGIWNDVRESKLPLKEPSLERVGVVMLVGVLSIGVFFLDLLLLLFLSDLFTIIESLWPRGKPMLNPEADMRENKNITNLSIRLKTTNCFIGAT